MKAVEKDRTGTALRLRVEVQLPVGQAAEFVEAMTGNDDDILLAAEYAIRERLTAPESVEEDEVELTFVGGDRGVRDGIRSWL